MDKGWVALKRQNKNTHKEKQTENCLGWRETFDASLDINALISTDFEILNINKAGYQNLRKKPQELIGKKCYEVVHGINNPKDGCPCEKTLKTKKPGEGQIYAHGRHYIATASPVLNENREIVAFAHSLKDITDRVHAEEALRNAHNEMEQKVKERTEELTTANENLNREIKVRNQTEKALRKSELRLQKQKSELAKKNIALQEVITQIGLEKSKMKNKLEANIEAIVWPILERMERDKHNNKYAKLLKNQLKHITSDYGIKIKERRITLTPREIEICNMVKAALTNKEIAKLLSISHQTVEWHRKRIRQKLELANKKINLGTYLHRL